MTDRELILSKMPSYEDRVLKSFSNCSNGAEHYLLTVLAGYVIDGRPIDQDLQDVANAIMVKAIFADRLPKKKIGRPESDDFGARHEIALTYFELVDSGTSYADAVAAISEKYHKDERHIMRIVKREKPSIGNTLEEREAKRKFWEMCAKLRQRVIDSGGKPADEVMHEAMDEDHRKWLQRDFIEEMDAKIQAILVRRFGADIK